ncbi:hypothetical protein LEP1GSC193_1175 [Leptospira alstonii serovar Pingchang str. 80-412]|uniref:Uncharacterized protein n=2 Tax=Leptospira alstonii TaxID=28452 RepID=M6CRT0_9LEPT|nr:hypothetical protein LEP1GSC194_2794 [Leptospira alstonii serovar Sichuan str. 79601]EQA82575.1 hypothetical protein LEP1GSC193_1175 [Leptospira alstonii serovar Pingchang str. 80-412]
MRGAQTRPCVSLADCKRRKFFSYKFRFGFVNILEISNIVAP